MKSFVAVSLCALCACTGTRIPAAENGAPVRTAGSGTAVVERVVDGDTIIVRLGGARVRVRLIGMDTPETVKPGTPVQCFGPEASAYTKELLPPGEQVRLVYDRQRLDRYGRTLAYVYRARDDLFVDLDLVRRGYARTLDIQPDDRFAVEFAAAEVRARASGLGLWGRCVT